MMIYLPVWREVSSLVHQTQHSKPGHVQFLCKCHEMFYDLMIRRTRLCALNWSKLFLYPQCLYCFCFAFCVYTEQVFNFMTTYFEKYMLFCPCAWCPFGADNFQSQNHLPIDCSVDLPAYTFPVAIQHWVGKGLTSVWKHLRVVGFELAGMVGILHCLWQLAVIHRYL